MGGASEEFGKDLGLIHEVFVTGRRAGWGKKEWARLAEDVGLMCRFRGVMEGWARIETPPVKVWRTIELGTHVSVEALATDIETNGGRFSREARKRLGRVKLAQAPTEVDLVLMSPEELGLEDGSTISQIYLRGYSLGLSCCPPEVGPQLRRQYCAQPMGESLWVASNPSTNTEVFLVDHDDTGLCLRTIWVGGPTDRWCAGRKLVFLLGRQSR